ncbi:uncharacterized protein LOC123636638 [Lemur catta]|uniref:uncharacterized protein LOC123636638 n=1 Tax=Lemur catta TaxID=9447 RepID=UPI001E26D068|nr:uncharacterized protein LOC123636638 [Lemur catta]XP_045405064.1 uncharacterized protein LOC123636638 [Lemur catta]XP_045405065.1 uncharacterized protein LOC123636638 [Lemur catta]XP_045405066.1 uncharacterized protein LOC123636638 [Lemur catta]XP_045405067.1 uncharacterized protein LOC123636638 [Lemur catta]XP_045405068.1 uncharacterized protein LOC123636638 [Lemur catta]XP_045405069.1 uncharacterized protein LOC123636638 [Lemur catta]XP_045405070.1 uncharacterized protein LOC123636638 [
MSFLPARLLLVTEPRVCGVSELCSEASLLVMQHTRVTRQLQAFLQTLGSQPGLTLRKAQAACRPAPRCRPSSSPHPGPASVVVRRPPAEPPSPPPRPEAEPVSGHPGASLLQRIPHSRKICFRCCRSTKSPVHGWACVFSVPVGLLPPWSQDSEFFTPPLSASLVPDMSPHSVFLKRETRWQRHLWAPCPRLCSPRTPELRLVHHTPLTSKTRTKGGYTWMGSEETEAQRYHLSKEEGERDQSGSATLEPKWAVLSHPTSPLANLSISLPTSLQQRLPRALHCCSLSHLFTSKSVPHFQMLSSPLLTPMPAPGVERKATSSAKSCGDVQRVLTK